MKRQVFLYLSMSVLLLLFAACAGRHKISKLPEKTVSVQDTVTPPETPSPIVKPQPVFKLNTFDYKWFSSRINADVTFGGTHYGVALFLVVAKDSVLYISCNKMGIEMGRLVCTTDSVKVMIHLNSTYWTGSYNDLLQETGLDLQYDLLQALFTNNDFPTFSRNFKKKGEDGGLQIWVDPLRRQLDGTTVCLDQVTLDSNERIYNRLLQQKNHTLSLVARYRNMASVENSNTLFPADITFSIPKLDFVLQMQYKTPKTNVKGPTGFKLSNKYKRLQLSKVL